MPYSNLHVLTLPPRGLTLANNVAELAPTLDVPLVSTDGAVTLSVVKEMSGPCWVPLPFLVTPLKWQVLGRIRARWLGNRCLWAGPPCPAYMVWP